jgi:hypothetical protein
VRGAAAAAGAQGQRRQPPACHSITVAARSQRDPPGDVTADSNLISQPPTERSDCRVRVAAGGGPKNMASSVWACTVAALALVLGIYQYSDNSSDDSGAPVGSGKMFDAIAPRYDLTNTILSLGMHASWREKMISALKLQPGSPESFFFISL